MLLKHKKKNVSKKLFSFELLNLKGEQLNGQLFLRKVFSKENILQQKSFWVWTK